MPGSLTSPGHGSTRDGVPPRLAFRVPYRVGSQIDDFAAQWLAYAIPYRRFVLAFAGKYARLGADVGRYSFIVVDFHHLLLAG